MNTPSSKMASVYDLYNEAMFRHAMEPPIFKAAPNTQIESETTRDRKGILSHPIPNNIANPKILEGTEIGTINESLLKLYHKVNGNIDKSSLAEEKFPEEKEGFYGEHNNDGDRKEHHHLGGNHHSGGNHHMFSSPSFHRTEYIPVVSDVNYYISSPHQRCNTCSTKRGDEIMFQIYMGSMTVVGLLILYRILQK